MPPMRHRRQPQLDRQELAFRGVLQEEGDPDEEHDDSDANERIAAEEPARNGVGPGRGRRPSWSARGWPIRGCRRRHAR